MIACWSAAGSETNLRIVCEYEPPAYELPLALIVCTETAREVGPENTDLGWRAIGGERLVTHEVPGDHVSMLAGENAAVLGALIVARLHP